jgi:hypothetical protein
MHGLSQYAWMIGEVIVLALVLGELFLLYREKWKTDAAERAKAAGESPAAEKPPTASP